MLNFLIKAFCLYALIVYVILAVYVLYRLIFKAGKNGSLPWL